MEYAAQNVWMKGEDMLLKKEAIRGHDTRKGRKRGVGEFVAQEGG